MTREIRLRMDMASKLLAQAADLDTTTKAEAIIHLCYYAMYHAAVAVLLARTGSAPAKHTGVIGQFGLLLRDADKDARAGGHALKLAFDNRVASDYDAGHGDVSPQATQLRNDAPLFLQLCERLLSSQ